MRIVHIDFSGPYTENMTYQENLLPKAMSQDGNKVFMLVPCYEWKNGKIIKTDTISKQLEDGVELRRYEFLRFGKGDFLSRKIRIVPRLYNILQDLNPDIIMFHCPQTMASFGVAKFIRKNPDKKLVIDSHSDYHNSAKSFWSKYFLHRIFYKLTVRIVERYATKVYYLTEETRTFYLNEYKGDASKQKFLPLGGIRPSEEEYLQNYSDIRRELGINDNTILFLHSGKISKEKKTEELITGFVEAECENGKLVIIGVCDEQMEPIIKKMLTLEKVKNKVLFLGWKSGNELIRYLCAADVYCQPGTQSATFQNAICCRCAVISFPHNAYKDKYVKGNGLWVSNIKEISMAIRYMTSHPVELDRMKRESEKIACDKLDYKAQGRMIIKDCI